MLEMTIACGDFGLEKCACRGNSLRLIMCDGQRLRLLSLVHKGGDLWRSQFGAKPCSPQKDSKDVVLSCSRKVGWVPDFIYLFGFPGQHSLEVSPSTPLQKESGFLKGFRGYRAPIANRRLSLGKKESETLANSSGSCKFNSRNSHQPCIDSGTFQRRAWCVQIGVALCRNPCRKLCKASSTQHNNHPRQATVRTNGLSIFERGERPPPPRFQPY